jgi:hypothetical protein
VSHQHCVEWLSLTTREIPIYAVTKSQAKLLTCLCIVFYQNIFHLLNRVSLVSAEKNKIITKGNVFANTSVSPKISLNTISCDLIQSEQVCTQCCYRFVIFDGPIKEALQGITCRIKRNIIPDTMNLIYRD